jgi:hypothetical protein
VRIGERRFVEMHKAERDGDTERLAVLNAEYNASVAETFATLGVRREEPVVSE